MDQDCALLITGAHADCRNGWVTGVVAAIQEEHVRFTPNPLRLCLDWGEVRALDQWEHRILQGLRLP